MIVIVENFDVMKVFILVMYLSLEVIFWMEIGFGGIDEYGCWRFLEVEVVYVIVYVFINYSFYCNLSFVDVFEVGDLVI